MSVFFNGIAEHSTRLRERLLELESIQDSFCGLVAFNADCFQYISSSVEQILGYPIEEFTKDGGVSFFYSLTPAEFMPYLNGMQVKILAEQQHPEYDCTAPQLIEMKAALNSKSGATLAIQFSGVTLELMPLNLGVGCWQDVTAMEGQEGLAEIRSRLNHLLMEIKSEYVKAHPQWFRSSKPSRLRAPVELFNPHETERPLLTPRETEALQLIAEGLSTNEMAGRMGVSFHTVETYRKHLIQKFKSKNTAELVKKASKIFWF